MRKFVYDQLRRFVVLVLLGGCASAYAGKNPFNPNGAPPPPPQPAPPPVTAPEPPPEPPKKKGVLDEEEQNELLSQITYIGVVNDKEMYRDEETKCYVYRKNQKIEPSPCFNLLVERLQHAAERGNFLKPKK